MSEHLLFVTGRLARPRLDKVLAAMAPKEFTYQVRDLGVKVAYGRELGALPGQPEYLRRRRRGCG